MEKRTYPVSNFPVLQLSNTLEDWYSSIGFETQVLNTQFKGIIIQARKEGFFRTVVGMSAAITVTINQTDSAMQIEVGGANWADKAGAAAIGIAVPWLWPTVISAGYGVYEQSKMIKQTWDVIDRYIQTYTRGSAQGSYQTYSSPGTPPPPSQFTPPPTTFIQEPVIPATTLLTPGQSWGRLVVDSGPYSGQVFELNMPMMTIGRNTDCNILLTKDDSVSRNHACIYQKDGEIFIADQGSSHGTFVNENPVATVTLKNNSVIQIGKTVMKFYSGNY